MPGLNMELIRHARIRLPPLLTQESFSGRVKRVSELRKHYAERLARVDTLFRALQSECFLGPTQDTVRRQFCKIAAE